MIQYNKMDKENTVDTIIVDIAEEMKQDNKEEKDEMTDSLLDTMDSYVEIVNVFLMYYQKLYNKTENLFQDVNVEEVESTNRSLELLYEFMTTQKENEKKDPALVEIYNPDDIDLKKYDEMHGLLIDGNIEKVSPTIMSLLQYVATLDWCTIDWKIMCIKNT